MVRRRQAATADRFVALHGPTAAANPALRPLLPVIPAVPSRRDGAGRRGGIRDVPRR